MKNPTSISINPITIKGTEVEAVIDSIIVPTLVSHVIKPPNNIEKPKKMKK